MMMYILDDGDTRRGVDSLNSVVGNKVYFCFPQVGQIYLCSSDIYIYMRRPLFNIYDGCSSFYD